MLIADCLQSACRANADCVKPLARRASAIRRAMSGRFVIVVIANQYPPIISALQ
jgi:hypothetical protein